MYSNVEKISTNDLYVSRLCKYVINGLFYKLIQLDEYIIVKKVSSDTYQNVFTDTLFHSIDYYSEIYKPNNNTLLVLESKPIDLYMKEVKSVIDKKELNEIFNYINSKYHSFDKTNEESNKPRDIILAGFYDASLKLMKKDIPIDEKQRLAFKIKNLCNSYVSNIEIVKRNMYENNHPNDEMNELMIRKLYIEKLSEIESEMDHIKDVHLTELQSDLKKIERILK